MTFTEWSNTMRLTNEYEHYSITDLVDRVDIFAAFIFDDCSWIVVQRDAEMNKYLWTICGNEEYYGTSMRDAAEFLWDNHAQHQYDD